MPSSGTPPALGEGRRLVVLPFDNLSPDSRDEYLADGMTEELISALSRIPGLSVIARTSAMHYKATDKTVAEVARELGVQSVLEGSVRRAGSKLRISIRLVDPVREVDLWSTVYDPNLEDVFAVQRDIATRIGRALKIRLARPKGPAVDSVSPPHANAHDLYLRGRFQWNLRSEGGLREAIRLFEQSVAADRTFALAYCGIADAWAQLGWLEFAAPTDAFPKARDAAEKALALDERLAEAHASLGFVRFLYERNWEGAESELQRAIVLNPGYPIGHQFHADYLKARGRFDEAMAEMRRALELDPVSMAVNTGFGHVLYLARDYDAAIQQYRKSLEIDPNFGPAHLWFGRPYLQKGMFDEAIAEIQKAVDSSGGSTISLAVLAHAYASAGKRAESLAILEGLLERTRTRYTPSYWIALVHVGLGDTAQAMAWLERAYEERSSWLVWIGVEPRFDPLRSEPRFSSLLRRMRLDVEMGTGAPRATAGRRLAAIMFTDIVGFTKLAQKDEATALRLLEEHRALVRPIFASRGGREVKTMGDGFLIEFPSAVESVRCATEIQSAMEALNARRKASNRVRLRIGIHVGDIIQQGSDILGDGVNVASRIEPLAKAGGICISGPVWEQVRNKVHVQVEKLNEAELKNVSTPVEVYRLV